MSKNQPDNGVLRMGVGRKSVTGRGNRMCEDSDVQQSKFLGEIQEGQGWECIKGGWKSSTRSLRPSGPW